MILGIDQGTTGSRAFLFDEQGEIHGVLDWEMAHLGDPLEDLAWGFNPVWSFGRPDLAGGLIDQAEAVTIWERTSGLKAEPTALHWWTLFNCVKGQAIWVGSAGATDSGATTAARPQRKAARLLSTDAPLSVMARSMASALTGRQPCW